MASLPSFVELMSSLGLSTGSEDSGDEHMRQSSPSPSPPVSPLPVFHIPSRPRISREKSPAIIVSQYESKDQIGEARRRSSSGNIRAARFSPYSSTSRRGSLPAVSDSQVEAERPRGTPASSSRRSSGNSANKAPTPRLSERRARRGSELEQLNIAAASCTPISSFARRRSPQTSPTSPSFAQQRSRSVSAELPSPVILPTLPPMLAESFTTFSFPVPTDNRAHVAKSRSPHLCPTALDSGHKAFVKHNQAGLRISSFHRQVSPIA